MSIISGPTTGKETTRSRPSGPGMPTGHQALAVGSPCGVLPDDNRNVANSRFECNTESAQRCRRQGKKLRRQPWTVCEALWCLFGTYSDWESPALERSSCGRARSGVAAWTPPRPAHGRAPEPRGLRRRPTAGLPPGRELPEPKGGGQIGGEGKWGKVPDRIGRTDGDRGHTQPPPR